MIVTPAGNRAIRLQGCPLRCSLWEMLTQAANRRAGPLPWLTRLMMDPAGCPAVTVGSVGVIVGMTSGAGGSALLIRTVWLSTVTSRSVGPGGGGERGRSVQVGG